MKYQTMINVIAGAGLVLGSFSTMAGPGWAFDYTGKTVVQQTAGSDEKQAHNKKTSSGGAGWAFDHPHEPAQGSSGRS